MKNFTAAYKDEDFLNFFYKMLKLNTSGRHQKEFPFLSRCGIERNFLRCDDTPIVYTELKENEELLRVGQSKIFHKFQPEKLWMENSGRVYHQCLTPIEGKALVSDKLTDKFYKNFEFNQNGQPIVFKWKQKRILIKK